MMKILSVHDQRWKFLTPPGHYAHFDVNENTPLSYFVSRTLQEAAAYAGEVQLFIMAHGLEVPGFGGGYGVAFCREGLNVRTIGLLAPLHGQIHGGIILFSCCAAHIAPTLRHPDGTILVGDGNVLCSRIAQITGTYVRAGTALQYAMVGADRTLVGAPWRGVVLTYAPSGAVAQADTLPN
jgi:hypothetical protein